MIDLSPCIGIYQEAVFFNNYQIDAAIQLKILLNPELDGLYTKAVKDSSLDKKILFLVSLETKQKRYRTQVMTPFVSKEQSELIQERLKTRLNREEDAQVECQIDFSSQENGNVKFSAKGFADVVKDDVVYELKFVSELTHEHFLQCACYMVAMNLQKGILWNTRDNTSFEIEVPNRKAFLDAVTKAVTKGVLKSYYEPGLFGVEGSVKEKFAVIDTETNWNDEVMSIGVIVADSITLKEIDALYYIIDPEYRVGGMYANELRFGEKGVCVASRKQALKEIKLCLEKYSVQRLFAYNACFDKKYLPEYSEYEWYDIMRLAAYRQYNRAIPDSADCYKTGRLKRGYGVENVLRMLSGNDRYTEVHNAVLDAKDELQIMQLLEHRINEYDIALISDRKTPTKRIQERENAVEGEINKKKRLISRIFRKKKLNT